MPRRIYKCRKCEHSFERLLMDEDEREVPCPKCKEKDVQRLPSSERLFEGLSPFGSRNRDTN